MSELAVPQEPAAGCITAALAAPGLAAAVWVARALVLVGLGGAELARLPLLGAGVLVGGFVGITLWRRLPVVPVLEHEVTHAASALFLGLRPTELRATEEEGHARYLASGGIRAALVRLAPYVVPTVPWVLAPLGWIVRPELLGAWRFTVAAAVGYQLVRIGRDLHRRQPDLQAAGLPVSVAFVAGWGALALELTLLGILGGIPALWALLP